MTAVATPAQQRRVLLIASLVSSLVMLDSNIVAVALPTIAHSLRADFADVQWVITAYVLPFAALLLAAGSFGDRIGRRRAAVLGQAVFALASLGCGLSTTPLMLNVSRAVQGAGASLLLTCALAIINHSFQGPARARAYAFWGASLGIAITCGPIIGGIISSVFGWQWAFLINLPICLALIVATLRAVPESRDPDATRLDYAGVVTFSAGLFLLTWGVIDGNALGWGSAPVLWRFGGGIALLVLFVVAESVQRRPMVDFALLRSKNFLGTTFAMIGYAGGAQVMIYYLPPFLQIAYGYRPVVAGIAMLPFALPMFVVPRLVAKVAAHWHTRSLLCLGLGVSAFANVGLAWLAGHAASYPVFAAAMVLAGTGAGLLNGDTAKAMQGALPAQRSGMASGVSATVRFSALLFGVAGLGAMLVSTTATRFVATSASWGFDAGAGVEIAKRFSAGDVTGASGLIPPAIHDVAMVALREAFDLGFSAAALTAAAVAVLAMIGTRGFMLGRSEHGVNVALAVPGE